MSCTWHAHTEREIFPSDKYFSWGRYVKCRSAPGFQASFWVLMNISVHFLVRRSDQTEWCVVLLHLQCFWRFWWWFLCLSLCHWCTICAFSETSLWLGESILSQHSEIHHIPGLSSNLHPQSIFDFSKFQTRALSWSATKTSSFFPTKAKVDVNFEHSSMKPTMGQFQNQCKHSILLFRCFAIVKCTLVCKQCETPNLDAAQHCWATDLLILTHTKCNASWADFTWHCWKSCAMNVLLNDWHNLVEIFALHTQMHDSVHHVSHHGFFCCKKWAKNHLQRHEEMKPNPCSSSRHEHNCSQN